MALMFLIMLTSTHFENLDLVMTALGNDFRRYRGTCDERGSDLYGFPFADHENLVKCNLCAHFCRYLFYFEFFASDDAILLAAGFYDRIHDGLLLKEPGILAENRGMDTSKLYSLITDDMLAVDTVIRTRLTSDVVLVRQVAEYIIAAGGKRMRPALVLLSAGAVGYAGRQHHDLAAVVEFIHTATLLHDDVVDESALRRGKDTANALFGNAASVLVGDFLYSRAFQMMVNVGNLRIMQVLSDATNIIAEGEVLQLMNCHNADISIDAYLQVIRFKTAKLFEAAAQIGALIGAASPAMEGSLARYGMHLGTAFQIIDDVLDYSGDEAKTGKHLGDDLAEGKPTLPLIHVMQQGTPEQAACVRHALENGGRDSFPDILKAVNETGALEVARSVAEKEIEHALEALGELPATAYKDALIQCAAFAVARRH